MYLSPHPLVFGSRQWPSVTTEASHPDIHDLRQNVGQVTGRRDTSPVKDTLLPSTSRFSQEAEARSRALVDTARSDRDHSTRRASVGALGALFVAALTYWGVWQCVNPLEAKAAQTASEAEYYGEELGLAKKILDGIFGEYGPDAVILLIGAGIAYGFASEPVRKLLQKQKELQHIQAEFKAWNQSRLALVNPEPENSKLAVSSLTTAIEQEAIGLAARYTETLTDPNSPGRAVLKKLFPDDDIFPKSGTIKPHEVSQFFNFVTYLFFKDSNAPGRLGISDNDQLSVDEVQFLTTKLVFLKMASMFGTLTDFVKTDPTAELGQSFNLLEHLPETYAIINHQIAQALIEVDTARQEITATTIDCQQIQQQLLDIAKRRRELVTEYNLAAANNRVKDTWTARNTIDELDQTSEKLTQELNTLSAQLKKMRDEAEQILSIRLQEDFFPDLTKFKISKTSQLDPEKLHQVENLLTEVAARQEIRRAIAAASGPNEDPAITAATTRQQLASA